MAYSRSVLGGTEEDYSGSVHGGSGEYFSRTLPEGSNKVHEIHCEPCKKDGNTVDAVKHCLDCSEYFCAHCFKSHTRFKAFQNHVINDVDKANPVIIKNTVEMVSKSVEALQIDNTNEQQSSRTAKISPSKKTNRKVKAELVSTIDVRTSGDKQTPYICDLTIVHAYYCVITDLQNMSVKVIDTRIKCVISEVQISEAEWIKCITSVNDGHVAVSVNIKDVEKLLFLFVSTSGIISKTDRYFADTVLCVSLGGKIKATYKDQDLNRPDGVTVDSEGYVYVCSTGTHCVHQLTAELDKVQVIISGVGVDRCAFNRVENRLYVSFRNEIKMYNIKYEKRFWFNTFAKTLTKSFKSD